MGVNEEEVTSLHGILPSAALAKANAGDVKSLAGASGLDWFALSAATPGTAFANVLSSLTPSANATPSTPSNDPVAQLAALVQSGIPLSTIVNTIAQSVSGSVQQQLAGTMSQSALDSLKSSLLQSITNALSPPGNAPPGTATQQVTALAARLQQLINAIARDAKTTAGQQNEISGNILDATSAKELPAQQKTNDASGTPDVSSLMRSILSNVVVALQGATTATVSPPSTPPTVAHVAPTPVKAASPVSNPLLAASAASVASSASQPATPANLVASPASSNVPTETGSASSITIANAPDLLARMLVRAASADPIVSGSAGAAAAQGGSVDSDTTLGISTMAARFASAISEGVTGASGSQNDTTASGNWLGGRGFSASDQSSTPTPLSATSNSNVAAVNAGANAQLQNLLQPQQVAAATPLDINSVIEQMIKSMSMRTNAQGTSTIQLHLQPENLGDVSMKITVTGTQITANMVAQNADVRTALVSNHQTLAKSLADAGLTLTGFSVDVSGGDARQQNQGQTSGFGRRYTVQELAGATNEDTTVSNLGPPLLSGSSIGLFNYMA